MVEYLPNKRTWAPSPVPYKSSLESDSDLLRFAPTHLQLTAVCFASFGKPGLYQPPLCASSLAASGGWR